MAKSLSKVSSSKSGVGRFVEAGNEPPIPPHTRSVRPAGFASNPINTTASPTQPLWSEAAWGIRSFADAPINASALDVSDILFRTNRDCGRSVAHTNDAAFVLDCAAEYARKSLRQQRVLPRDDLELGVVFNHYDPEPSLSDEPPNRPGPVCEDIVDEAPRSCASFAAMGYCVASCSPYWHGRHNGNGHHEARSVVASYSAAAAGTCLGSIAYSLATHDPFHHPTSSANPDIRPPYRYHGALDVLAPRITTHCRRPPTIISDFNVTMLVSSDFHMEPWYDTSNNRGQEAGGDYRVSRYVESTVDMRYVCRDATEGGEVADGCPVTNRNDPPLNFVNTHIDWFFQHQSGAQTISDNTYDGGGDGGGGGDGRVESSSSDESVVVALIVGDVQAHDESQDYMQQDWIDNIYDSTSTVLQVHEHPMHRTLHSTRRTSTLPRLRDNNTIYHRHRYSGDYERRTLQWARPSLPLCRE